MLLGKSGHLLGEASSERLLLTPGLETVVQGLTATGWLSFLWGLIPMAPSIYVYIQIISTLGLQVCKQGLHWAVWSPRVLLI